MRKGLLKAIGPGVLVAATGVGAGDLATASFTGSRLGTAVLWAVVFGAAMKFALNEGLARWQLATGQTFIEGMLLRFGKKTGWIFLPYLVLWSFFVGSALMSACGIALHALVPVFDAPEQGKVVFGVLASAVGLVLALVGGFKLFEKVMSACILAMFVTVVLTAVMLVSDWGSVLSGLFIPSIPDAGGTGLTWTVALIGGVGGTLTILCYGYWIREEGRSGPDDLALCRLDLAVGYAVTAFFGVAMVIIGSTITIEGKGAALLVELSARLDSALGPTARWAFLIGAFGAVFSSLLGVWQAVPYLFADVARLMKGDETEAADLTRSPYYRGYMIFLSTVPILGLFVSFREIQKLYAVIGALFMPLVALLLLIMNGRRQWVADLENRWLARIALIATLAFFAWSGIAQY